MPVNLVMFVMQAGILLGSRSPQMETLGAQLLAAFIKSQVWHCPRKQRTLPAGATLVDSCVACSNCCKALWQSLLMAEHYQRLSTFCDLRMWYQKARAMCS